MKKIVLSFEYRCLPIWIYEDNDLYDDLPPEWENEKEFIKILLEAKNLYASAFLNTNKEFTFVGFKNKDDLKRMNSLLEKIRKFISKNLPEGYEFEDRVKTHNQLDGF